MAKFTVTDWQSNIVINGNVTGKSCSEVLARYNAKAWIIRDGLQLEVTKN